MIGSKDITWEYPKEKDIVSEIVIIKDWEEQERLADLIEDENIT